MVQYPDGSLAVFDPAAFDTPSTKAAVKLLDDWLTAERELRPMPARARTTGTGWSRR